MLEEDGDIPSVEMIRWRNITDPAHWATMAELTTTSAGIYANCAHFSLRLEDRVNGKWTRLKRLIMLPFNYIFKGVVEL